MPDRTIIFEDLKTPQDIHKLKQYIRELYSLIDPRMVEIDFTVLPTFDADEADVFLITLTDNITGIVLKNAYEGRKITILFKQDGTGGRTITGWPANVKLAGAAAIGGDGANEYSTISLVYDGTNWIETARTSDVK